MVINNNVQFDTRFGFRVTYSTIHNVYRVVNAVSYFLQN